jgi:hypothetical protein
MIYEEKCQLNFKGGNGRDNSDILFDAFNNDNL